MEVVDIWNGRRACSLQVALRMSNETFAGHLGIGVRTVASWHDKPEMVPRPDLQQILDTALERAPAGAKSRLGLLFKQDAVSSPDAGNGHRLIPAPRESLEGAQVAQHGEEVTRRVLLGQTLAGAAMSGFSLLATAESVRRELEDTLTAGTVSPSRLDRIEETVASHLRIYTTTPPAAALAGLLLDFMDVRQLCAERQPATIQSRLSEIATLLATLAADSLMKLGRVSEARAWYGTARIAADDTSNRELRARVRAQEAMLPYYYGNPAEAVRIAREARNILGELPRAAGALAFAAEARALARQGVRAEAESAMVRAQELVELVHEPDNDEAFRFGERRLLFYMSSTLSNLGEAVRAHRVQDQALALYGDSAPLIDPALIQLDRAQLLVAEGDLGEAVSITQDACLSLGDDYRTPVIAARVQQIADAIPQRGEARQVLSELRRTLIVSAEMD